MKTLDVQVSDSIAGERLETAVLVSFGSAALALAMPGIYGVLSSSVAGRKPEIGVRIALSATRGSLYAATTLLYGIQGVEPGTLAMVVALLLASALAAGFVPARRAASVDPMEALRME